MPTSETITILANYHKPEHHLLTLSKSDAPFLVDLRPNDDFLQKHVVGSKNIPFSALLLHRDALKSQEKIILLAEADTLPQAEEAYLVLTALGFKPVFIVPNGLNVCKIARLSFTTLADARVQAFSSWFKGLPQAEKIPTIGGFLLILFSLFSGKRRGFVFGMGSTLLGFGLRNQLKTEQASTVGQWMIKQLLKKFA
jgi:rhodanese-related sulfurtransferase